MKTWIVGITALAIAVIAIALLWDLQSGGKTSVPEQGKAAAAQAEVGDLPAPDRAESRNTVRARAAAATQPPTQPSAKNGDPAPLAPEERTEEFERLLAGEVPGRIREAAAPCYDGSGISYKRLENSDDSIDFDFTLRLKSGVVTLENLKLTKGIGNQTDGCVMRVLSRLSWRDQVNPDFTMDMSDSISLLALKKWGEPMPHEIEEVPEEPPEE
ncbi:MAG: hypothetical protein MJE77_07670 [Proteobacteria bacterium]|nr:hypothetical protein [Pseudomonadota bacterium]